MRPVSLLGWNTLWAKWRHQRLDAAIGRRAINDALWDEIVSSLPFLTRLPASDTHRLRRLASLFLDTKEFTATKGLTLTDRHVVMVAVQACLPILHIAPPDRPDLALAWYDRFVEIVLYPSQVRAKRVWSDDSGVVHHATQIISGEVSVGGPLVLAWPDVESAGELAGQAYNVVIHEFAHVMDLRDGVADACPPMAAAQRSHWLDVLRSEFKAFQSDSQAHRRFGAMGGWQAPLLDEYGAISLDEFFAVAAESYFVQTEAFSARHPRLKELFDGFFLGAQ